MRKLDPDEKYYSYIKEMASRPRRIDPFSGYELGFRDIEYALYGLAKFKKAEDKKIIRDKLEQHSHELSDISFNLMKEYPDTLYMEILEYYHKRFFYNFSGEDIGGFTGSSKNRARSGDFIYALVEQQNQKSARLLDTILNNLRLVSCVPNKESIEDEVILQIWENPNPIYNPLKNRVKAKAEKIMERQIQTYQIHRKPEAIDTTKENYRWFP